MSSPDPESSVDRQSPGLWPVGLGVGVAFIGVTSYFLYFAYMPNLRDFPWVNLPLVLLGLGLTIIGFKNALHVSHGRVAKLVSGVLLLLTLGLAGLFCTYVFYLSYQLPDDDGVVSVGDPVPEFSLLNQAGEIIQPSLFSGKRVVVSFYRGDW